MSKYLDPRWQKKRLKIFERDGWMCNCCGDTEEALAIHHDFYEADNPWDDPDEALVTLCVKCHSAIHRLLKLVKDEGNNLEDVIPRCNPQIKREMAQQEQEQRFVKIFDAKISKQRQPGQ